MLASDALSHDLEVYLVPPHVGRLFNDQGSLNIDIGGATALLESNSLVDAVGPHQAERGHDALPSGLVLEEALVGSVVVYVSHHVVQNDHHQVEVPGKSFQLAGVSDHELGPFDVVYLAVWLDEVLADRVDVVNHHKLDLLLLYTGCQVDE